MKIATITSFLIGLFFLASTAFADPFLVADPQVNVTAYDVDLDGVIEESTPEDLGDGTVMLKYDVEGIDIGSHTARARAKNVWGVSAWSVPLDFTKQLPGVPSGIGLSAD